MFLTLLLNGALNKIMFLPHSSSSFCRIVKIVDDNFNASLKPLFFSVSSSTRATLPTCSLSLDISDNFLQTKDGIHSIIDGRWLDYWGICCKLWFCFLYGQYIQFFKLNDTTRYPACKITLQWRYNYVSHYVIITYFFVPICVVLLRSFLT